MANPNLVNTGYASRGPMNHQGILIAPRFGLTHDVAGEARPRSAF